jgi:hypothetical protein
MNSSKPENTCNICQKTFTRRADCTRHARLHAGIKPYRCEVEGCGKRFAQFTALKTHNNVHTGLKPFRCGYAGCRSTFGDPSSCTRHRKEMHTPRKPYECFFPGCKSTILRSSAFKAHLRRHGEQYVEMFKRQETSAKAGSSTGIEEEPATLQGFSVDQMNMLDNLDAWGFPSFPEDASVSMGLQAGPSAGPSRSSPLVLSQYPPQYPQAAPSDTGYFLSPPRASPLPSSRYSSPMLPTPDLSPMYPPTMGLDFSSGVGARLGPCLQDWTQASWQDDGTQFL